MCNLTGLPPTQKEIDDYLTDEDADRREKLIERLLKSKKYGEKWGRHCGRFDQKVEMGWRPHFYFYRQTGVLLFNGSPIWGLLL